MAVFSRGTFEAIPVTDGQMIDEGRQRIEWLYRRRSKSKANLILRFEELHDQYVDTGEPPKELMDIIGRTVAYYARGFERSSKAFWLSYQDFEELFWDEAYVVMDDDSHPVYYRLEVMEVRFKSRGRDLLDRAKTEKHSHQYKAKRLHRGMESPGNVENEVVNRLTVEQMFAEESLTEKERELLWTMYENPEGSLRDWGEALGIDHKAVAWRLGRVRLKLTEYNIDGLSSERERPAVRSMPLMATKPQDKERSAAYNAQRQNSIVTTYRLE